MDLWRPRVLVLGPGGVRGFCFLGFLCAICDAGLLEETDIFCGVSIGGLISMLLVCGYKPREIIKEGTGLDIFKNLEPLTLTNIISARGLVSNKTIEDNLRRLIVAKFGSVPTFAQLYDLTGKALICVTLNTTDETCQMMDPSVTPNLNILDAVLRTINIPFLMQQLVQDGKTYVDGALANPYPVDYFDDGNTNILGIYLKTVHNDTVSVSGMSVEGSISPRGGMDQTISENTPNVSQHTGSILQNTTSVYLQKIFQSAMDQRRISIIQNCSVRVKHAPLECVPRDALGIMTGIDAKGQMLSEGYTYGQRWVEQLKSNQYVSPAVPKRPRYSYPPE